MPRFVCLALIVCLPLSSVAHSKPAELAVRGTALDEAMHAGTFRQVTSVLVSSGGELVYEQYWGEGGPDVLNNTRSATKSLTAMAVGAAIMDGHITGVGTPALSFFRDEQPFRHPSPQKSAITIEDLLTMSSAFDCNDNDSDSPGNENNMHETRRWTRFVVDLPTKSDYQRNSAGRGPFSYCTAGSFLLGQIVERAVGQPVDQYIESRLLKPLGIDRVAWYRSRSGEVQTGGGAEFTSRSLLRLAELVRQGGQFDGARLLREDYTTVMLSAQLPANDVQDYGYQWWRRDFACDSGSVSGWYMAGNGGNKVVIFDELDMTVVVTATLYGTRGMHQQTTDIVEDYVLPGVEQCQAESVI
ncbi:MAG: serine hydrolase [Pseudomonadota bacterium]